MAPFGLVEERGGVDPLALKHSGQFYVATGPDNRSLGDKVVRISDSAIRTGDDDVRGVLEY